MFRLIQIQRSQPQHRFKATLFEKLDDAVWAARESHEDYLIEEVSDVGTTMKAVKYRLGEFEMGRDSRPK
jgi:hypothetical protein